MCRQAYRDRLRGGGADAERDGAVHPDHRYQGEPGGAGRQGVQRLLQDNTGMHLRGQGKHNKDLK